MRSFHMPGRTGAEIGPLLLFLVLISQTFIPGTGWDVGSDAGVILAFGGATFLTALACAVICLLLGRRYAFSGRAPVVVSSTKRADPPDGLLECASRGFAMRLRLFERDGAIHFTSTGYCFELGRWRLPIPSLLTPGAAHVVHSDEGDGWFRFTMSFRHRWFGETYFQEGLFHQADEVP